MKQIACCCDCYSTDIRIEGLCSWDDLTQAITLDETTEIYCNDCDTEVDDYEVWPVEKVERLRQEYLASQDESEEVNYCDDCGIDDDTVVWDDLNDVQLCKKCKEKREGYAADQYAADMLAQAPKQAEAKKNPEPVVIQPAYIFGSSITTSSTATTIWRVS